MYVMYTTQYRNKYILRTGLQDNANLSLLKLTDVHSELSLYVIVTLENWTNMSILISSIGLFSNICDFSAGKVEVSFKQNKKKFTH